MQEPKTPRKMELFNSNLNKILGTQQQMSTSNTTLEGYLELHSKIIDPKFNIDSDTQKSLITIGENASKGIHIHTTKIRKEALEVHFAKPNTFIKIGNYTISAKEIKYTQLKESKWEIDIVYLNRINILSDCFDLFLLSLLCGADFGQLGSILAGLALLRLLFLNYLDLRNRRIRNLHR
jgi:hypothetical protein